MHSSVWCSHISTSIWNGLNMVYLPQNIVDLLSLYHFEFPAMHVAFGWPALPAQTPQCTRTSHVCLWLTNWISIFVLFRGFASIPNLGFLHYHATRHIEVKIPSSHTNRTKVLFVCNDNLDVELLLAHRR
jgi:hypothetical protein